MVGQQSKTFAISTVLVVAIVIIVIIIGAVSYALMLSKSSSSSLSSSTLQSSSIPQVSNTSSSFGLMAQSNTTSSSSVVTATPSSGSPGRLVFSFAYPGTLVASPDLSSMNYSFAIVALGSVPSNLSLSASASDALSVSVFPKTVNMNGSEEPSVSLQIVASPITSPGDYQLAISASGGGQTYRENETVEILKYLIVTIGTTFVPQNLTVTTGSTVTWLRLNGALSQYDNGAHDVDFSSGTSAVSPTLLQYASWSYTFNETGTYNYYCKYHPFMTGEINVVS